jgi:hypothetical protein
MNNKLIKYLENENEERENPNLHQLDSEESKDLQKSGSQLVEEIIHVCN